MTRARAVMAGMLASGCSWPLFEPGEIRDPVVLEKRALCEELDESFCNARRRCRGGPCERTDCFQYRGTVVVSQTWRDDCARALRNDACGVVNAEPYQPRGCDELFEALLDYRQ